MEGELRKARKEHPPVMSDNKPMNCDHVAQDEARTAEIAAEDARNAPPSQVPPRRAGRGCALVPQAGNDTAQGKMLSFTTQNIRGGISGTDSTKLCSCSKTHRVKSPF